MTQVPPFHTDADSPKYHPRERYVYHSQSDCAYGKEVVRDGHGVTGIGKDPDGNPREPCDRCATSSQIPAIPA